MVAATVLTKAEGNRGEGVEGWEDSLLEKVLALKPRDLRSNPSTHIKAMYSSRYLYPKTKAEMGRSLKLIGQLSSPNSAINIQWETLSQTLRMYQHTITIGHAHFLDKEDRWGVGNTYFYTPPHQARVGIGKEETLCPCCWEEINWRKSRTDRDKARCKVPKWIYPKAITLNMAPPGRF